MKNFALLFSSLLLFVAGTFAQTIEGKVTGSVKDESGKSIESATVSLLKSTDSSVVKLTITSKSGFFEFDKLKAGNYFLDITGVGFSKLRTKVFAITANSTTAEFPDLELATSAKSLTEVTVTARKPMVENKIDKTVVNVDAFISNAGSTALEVLEKSPGITVDRDGNISLKGKQGVIVLIDGKQTYLGAQDLANYLRNMPSNQLDQVEIMTQPSAKYDASGNSGIINIKTKRSRQSGFNGSVSLSYIQGAYPKSPNSININYRRNKINLFSSYSYSYWQGFSDIHIQRRFNDQSSKELTAVFDQNTFSRFKGNNHNLRVGMDYLATKKTTLGFVLTGMYNPRQFRADSKSEILDGESNLDSTNLAVSTNRDPWKNFGANLNFRHMIDTSGSELTADFDFLYYNSHSQQTSTNYTLHQPGDVLADSFLLRGNLPSIIKIYSGKVDYVKPLKKNARFEAGFKTSYVETDNDAQYSKFDEGENGYISDTTRSNHFLYTENINAAYANVNKQFKKFGVQAGLRLEQTISKGKQLSNAESFSRQYAQLFPTVYLSYAADKSNNFGLSYGRRIERPNYQDMNPFQYFLDQYTYRQGNPNLTPQFSHNIEFSHNYKGKLNTSLNFTQTTDIINDILKQNDTTKVTFQTKENIAKRRNVGISVSLNTPVTKWWTTSVFVNIYNNFYEGIVNNERLRADITSGMMNFNNQFKFNKGWGGELSGFFRTKTLETGLIVSEPMGTFSLGASKQILKSKGTIKVSVQDPFYVMRFKGYSKFGNIDMNIYNKWDNRRLTINFTYRFGKNQQSVPAPRRRSSSAQDEQNRVGGGGQQ